MIERECDGVKGAGDCRGEKDYERAVVAAADALQGIGRPMSAERVIRSEV